MLKVFSNRPRRQSFLNEVTYNIKSEHLISDRLFHFLTSFLLAVVLVLMWFYQRPLVGRLTILCLMSLFLFLFIIRYRKTYPSVLLTATHIKYTTGIFNRVQQEFLIQTVSQIKLHRPLFCNILASGSIDIYAYDMKSPIITIRDQRNPELVAQKISSWIRHYLNSTTLSNSTPDVLFEDLNEYMQPKVGFEEYRSN